MWRDLTKKQKIIFLATLVLGGSFWGQHAHSSGGDIRPAVDCSIVANSTTHSVTVNDTGFQPTRLTARLCDRLTFINTGARWHQPAAGPHPSHKSYPEINAPRALRSGQSFTAILTRPGDYQFHDHYHQELVGKLSVTAGSNP